ncbi:MAG: M20 family metallopeptidase, partial [Planctomycetota bacterium]
AIRYEHRVTRYLLEFFAALDVTCVELPVETVQGITRSNVVATIPARDHPETLMLQAHQDTVPVDGMTVRPFAAEQQGGRIYGRGACDIKGALGTLLAIAARLVQAPPSRHPSVVFAFTMNEECGFTGATAMSTLLQAGRLPGCETPPSSIIVSEPTGLDVVVGHKGVTRWRCHTHGRAGHSSSPEAGVNAIYAMSRVLERLQRFADHDLALLDADPLLGRPTLSVGTIQGGISVNTIPDHCTIEIDRRTLPSEDPDEARQAILTELEQLDLGVASLAHDAPFMQSPGLPATRNAGLARELSAFVQAAGHAGKLVGAPYGTDAAALAQGGIPTVVFGPGQIAQAHTEDEWIEVAQLEAAEAILWDWLCHHAATGRR